MRKLFLITLILVFFIPVICSASIVICGTGVKIDHCVAPRAYVTVLSGSTSCVLNNVSAHKSLFVANETTTLKNSIFEGSAGSDITIATGKAVTGTYNLFGDSAKAGDGTYTDTGTLFSSDPLFTAVATNDFSLTSSSPAINAGSDPFTDGDGARYDYLLNQVWDDTTDSPIGNWADGVEIGAFSYLLPVAASGLMPINFIILNIP